MSNGIRLRQNEEHSIEMLAAQRQLYSNAKRYDWLSTALSVWIPLEWLLFSCLYQKIH